jgi:hypothetical protein
MTTDRSRSDQLREARAILERVRYLTGNDHPGYERLGLAIGAVYALESTFADWGES